MPLNLKDHWRDILWVISLIILIYGGLVCMDVQKNCKAYQLVDQQGNAIPLEDLQRFVDAYNRPFEDQYKVNTTPWFSPSNHS